MRTCELRSASAEDLLTQQIDFNYNPDATAEEWNSFLDTILGGENELIDYIHRGIGYTLNGTQLERVFFFLCGLGMNGKSQLMAALRRVLGPYALECKPETFMEKKYTSSGPDEGQASLKGRRLLTATEIKRGQNLDVSLVKRMTGGEPIWHERKFQRGFSFEPTHTLWLSGNHEPRIKDTTDSIWDRLNKVDFNTRIRAD
ncbi:phage/plasmid primase, P4 family [Chloroflexota bacterium]